MKNVVSNYLSSSINYSIVNAFKLTKCSTTNMLRITLCVSVWQIDLFKTNLYNLSYPRFMAVEDNLAKTKEYFGGIYFVILIQFHAAKKLILDDTYFSNRSLPCADTTPHECCYSAFWKTSGTLFLNRSYKELEQCTTKEWQTLLPALNYQPNSQFCLWF